MPDVSYNCECEDGGEFRTLAELRTELVIRMGYAAQVDNLPPGYAKLMDSFLQGAQRALYRRYSVLRTERIFRWPLVEGVRFYDLDGNDDDCPKKMDPDKITWVGVERGDQWVQLRCGIRPENYGLGTTGWPALYEIRQCIEIWPAPDDTVSYLRVKGHFGLQRFTEDTDRTTVDDEAVLLLALANAKAHEGQPDAANYVGQLEAMIANLVAGTHLTKRYVQSTRPLPLSPEPIWVTGEWP